MAPPEEPPPRSQIAVAALLTAIWPGLGQWLQGRRRRAILFGLPMLAIAIGAMALLAGGAEAAALRLFDPTFALVAFSVVVFMAILRIVALGEHVVAAGGPRRVRRVDLAIAVVLALLVVESHVFVGRVALSFHDAGTAIFDAGPTAGPLPERSLGPSETVGPASTPLETPATAESRINVLLLGVDSSTERTHSLTDTMIVASFDPKTGSTSMVSFPRDIARFPLYDGGSYNSKLNSFLNYAAAHPTRYPDGGPVSLMRELGYLLGIPMHYYASVNLDGFVVLVDALDHVTVDNPHRIDDYTYKGWTDGRPIGFHLAAGMQNLDGQEALAFARSRKGAGDNDFTRAGRQQLLLSAVRRRLTDPSLLPRLPAIIDAASKTLRTNYPPDGLAAILALGREVDDAGTRREVLGPPYSVHPPTNTTGGTYILRLDLDRVRTLSVELYGADSAFSTP